MRRSKPVGRPIKLDKKAEARMQKLYDAIRSGQLTIVAELEGTEVVVPLELLRGDWQLLRDQNYLVATDGRGNEVGPRYYRPIFGPLLS